eukprot:jgi/Mesvir1/27888/Mv05588-RA.1
MSQYVIDQKDLSAVNYVIENALYTDKLLKDDLTIDDTTKTISFKLANVPSITFTIPHTLVPNAEKYNLGTPKYTATASERTWISPVFAVAAMDWADIFYNTPACPKGCMKTLATRMFQDAGRQSAQRSEVDVRDNVALRVGGQVEVKVGDTSMRADIVSYKCKMLLEVKEFTRWTDAVGQLLVYGHHFPGLTKVIVVFDRDGKDIAEEQLDLIEFHVQGLDMMVCTEQYFEKYTV